MPWRPLPRIAFAIATHPFQPSEPADLPLELGDELYIIEEGGKNWAWFRGYLVAPPSLLAGLTSVKGQTLEARVFSGIFPRSCVEVREYLGESDQAESQDRLSTNSDAETQEEPHRRVEGTTVGESPWAVAKDTKASNTNGSGTATTHLPQPLSREMSSARSRASRSLATTVQKHQRPPAPVPMLKIGDETPTSATEPLVDEIASCLREWHSTNLHELLLSRQYTTLKKLSSLVTQLDASRRQLLHGVLTSTEAEDLRLRTVWDLVEGNKMLGNEIVIRDAGRRGRLLTGSDSPIDISKQQATMSILDAPPAQAIDNVNLHHLLAEVKDFSATDGTDGMVLLANLSIKKGPEALVPLTESFSMALPTRENLQKTISTGRLRTLFPDLTSMDAGLTSGSDVSLYLVIRVVANQEVLRDAPEPVRPTTARESPTPRKDHSSTSSSVGSKGGRRSILWTSTRSQRHRTPISKLDDVSENSQEVSSPPRTRSSSRPQTQSKETQRLKRFVGVAVLPLDDLLSHNLDTEREVVVWSPGASSQTKEDFDTWDDAIRDVLVSPNGAYTRLEGLSSLKIRLASFICPDADELIRVTPTILHNISKTSRIGFSGAPRRPRSDIYITLKEPKLADGALFSHPERGFVALNSGLNMRNLQLTLEVRKADGSRIDNCIFPSSESNGLTAWRSVAIVRGGKWDQTFRLSIPIDDVPAAHIIMSIAEAPGFPFALCWMPLWNNGAFVQDGAHFATLHLYDKITSNTENGRGAYLDLAWDSKSSKDNWKFESVAGPFATLSLESFLCSTTFTQDQVLLGVLRWKEQADSDLILLLRQVIFVPEIEIVKLISEVLDALFAILVDRSGEDEVEDLVFIAIVTVLGIVHDRRFKLGPVVDEYAAARFNYPFATPCLIRSFLRLITRPADYQNSRQLRATFKVGQQIMKFIMVARKQQVAKEASIGVMNTQSGFSRDFKAIFHALETQMREESALAVGNKTLLVQHIHTWLPELRICFDEDRVVDIAANFINACENVQGKLILHKLVLLWNVLNDSKIHGSEVNSRYTSKLHAWLKPYWGDVDQVTEQYREQVRLCCSILSLLDCKYDTASVDYYIDILTSYACIMKSPPVKTETFAMLFPSTYPFQGRTTQKIEGFDESLTELATLKATVSASEVVKHLDTSRSDLADLVLLALEVDRSIISNDAFPSSWLTLHVYQHRAIFDMLEGVSKVLLTEFLPSPEDADHFNTEIWKQFLLSTLKLVRSDTLTLETFPEQKRRAVWKIGGDIREKGAALLSTIWNALGWETEADEKELYGLDRLGGYQVQYVPSLVSPIVELCLSVHGGLRSVAVEIMQSMIISEWSLNEDLSIIQAEMVVCLDNLFKTKSVGDNAQQRLFIDELNDAFRHLEGSSDAALWQAIQELVKALDDLLDLLIATHAPDQDETHKIMHTLQLMEFLREMQKVDIYIGYVHQLAMVEAHERNFKEAGLALRLHADIYSWGMDDVLPELANPPMPQQSSFERKEQIYFEMISYFEEGSAWEPALACYRELAERYEHTSFDFVKLARTQRAVAKIYEMIARGESSTPRFFRVIYSGLGFPANLRDKQFICEGSSSERLANFTDRLLQQHPSARLINHGEPENVEGQYLQVTAMTPHRDLENPLYQRQKVSHSTKEFLSSLKTQRFSITTRRYAPKSGVKDQRVEKTIYTTVDVFPTILRRSEILSEETVSLTPLETALERTLRKSYELAILDRRVTNGDDSSMFSLVEALRSSVDPSSSSSVAQYRELLPLVPKASTDDAENRRMQPTEIALQSALIDFASTLKHSLTLFARSGNELEYRTLSLQFAATFAPELAILAPSNQVGSAPYSSHGLVPTPPPTARPPTNGYHTSEPQLGSMQHVTPPYPSSPDARHTSRTRVSTIMKRSSMAPTVPTALPHINGNAVDVKNSLSITDDPVSGGHGRPSIQERRRDNLATRASEDTATTRETKQSSQQRHPEEDIRPMTAHSALTHKSGRSSKKTGSIRKRFSTMGMTIGKKPSRGTLINEQARLQEE